MHDPLPTVVIPGEVSDSLIQFSADLKRERLVRDQIAAEIEAFADDHSDVSDAYRHAALIAKGTPAA